MERQKNYATPRRLQKVLTRVRQEISGNASSGGRFAAGLAAEGYAGGYAQALRDVLLALNGVEPTTRDYWRDVTGAP